MPIDDDENDEESLAFMTAGDPEELSTDHQGRDADEPEPQEYDDYDDDLPKPSEEDAE